jgi:nuclear transport factor 2 (NTF2) superfamily protein
MKGIQISSKPYPFARLHRLVKTLWCYEGNRIAVRFQYEWHDEEGQWYRSEGNEVSPLSSQRHSLTSGMLAFNTAKSSCQNAKPVVSPQSAYIRNSLNGTSKSQQDSLAKSNFLLSTVICMGIGSKRQKGVSRLALKFRFKNPA